MNHGERLRAAARPRPVTITFSDLDALVGGLPPSARTYPPAAGIEVEVGSAASIAWLRGVGAARGR